MWAPEGREPEVSREMGLFITEALLPTWPVGKRLIVQPENL